MGAGLVAEGDVWLLEQQLLLPQSVHEVIITCDLKQAVKELDVRSSVTDGFGAGGGLEYWTRRVQYTLL